MYQGSKERRSSAKSEGVVLVVSSLSIMKKERKSTPYHSLIYIFGGVFSISNDEIRTLDID